MDVSLHANSITVDVVIWMSRLGLNRESHHPESIGGPCQSRLPSILNALYPRWSDIHEIQRR